MNERDKSEIDGLMDGRMDGWMNEGTRTGKEREYLGVRGGNRK